MVLFSGGLDSILACKILEEQQIRVTALKFITPFFGYETRDREDEYREAILKKYGINVVVIDITDSYLPMLRNPAHGHGKHFNPCIDCKILMVKKAIELLPRFNADFIATGEVIGQRPMSQRRDTLNCITNDSGAGDLLLRPLSASSLKPTLAEKRGWIDRDKLPHASGRGRKVQFRLAEKYGIRDFPSPAGGCVLADPIQGRRLKKYFAMWPEMDANDCCLALTGRQFFLPGARWFVAGRDLRENIRLKSLAKSTDILMDSLKAPAPAAIIREKPWGMPEKVVPETLAGDIETAASIIRHYCKKCSGVLEITVHEGDSSRIVRAGKPADRKLLEQLLADSH